MFKKIIALSAALLIGSASLAQAQHHGGHGGGFHGGGGHGGFYGGHGFGGWPAVGLGAAALGIGVIGAASCYRWVDGIDPYGNPVRYQQWVC